MFRVRKYIQNVTKIVVSMFFIVLNIMFCVETWTKQPGLLYILMWGSVKDYYNLDSESLMNCEYQNCYFTGDVKYFQDPLDYDVILFHAQNIKSGMNLPEARSQTQLYILVSMESAANNPIYSENSNYFFNYTWTYKLNSDVPHPYFLVRNRSGEIIAPKMHVNWILHKDMQSPDNEIVKKLQKKSISAAWFVSNCDTSNNNSRLLYIRRLRTELNLLDHQIDIYGNCDANKECPKHDMNTCYNYVENQYYFYLSFENSFSEDYVTEKLLTAVDHYAVPVVYGGADYSRFLPDGAYINARDYKPMQLAKIMADIITDRRQYNDFFRFLRYYKYYAIDHTGRDNAVCVFCKFVNNVYSIKGQHTYVDLIRWWNT